MDQIFQIAGETTGIDQDFLRSLAFAESSWRPTIKHERSGAKGLFQMTERTWRDSIEKYGPGLGISFKDEESMMAARGNPLIASLITGRLLGDERGRYQRHFKRDPEPNDLHVIWHAGWGTGKALLEDLDRGRSDNPLTMYFSKNAVQNDPKFFIKPDGKPYTIQEHYDRMEQKLRATPPRGN